MDNYSIFIPWEACTPTYRDREKPNAPPSDPKNIKRFNLFMRRLKHHTRDELIVRSAERILIRVVVSSEAKIVLSH